MVEPNLKRQLDFMESELARSEWFAGDEFSAADIQMSFPVEAAAQRAGLDASRPKLMAFLKKIHARPAYRRALERGGPVQLRQRLSARPALSAASSRRRRVGVEARRLARRPRPARWPALPWRRRCRAPASSAATRQR